MGKVTVVYKGILLQITRRTNLTPHHNQAEKSKYPKTRKLASSGENVQFFVLGAL